MTSLITQKNWIKAPDFWNPFHKSRWNEEKLCMQDFLPGNFQVLKSQNLKDFAFFFSLTKEDLDSADYEFYYHSDCGESELYAKKYMLFLMM